MDKLQSICHKTITEFLDLEKLPDLEQIQELYGKMNIDDAAIQSIAQIIASKPESKEAVEAASQKFLNRVKALYIQFPQKALPIPIYSLPSPIQSSIIVRALEENLLDDDLILHKIVQINGIRASILTKALNNGASTQTRDVKGATPLHIAAEKLNTVAIKALCKHGADPKAKDQWGNTPLHSFCIAANEEFPSAPAAKRAIQELLQLGADINARNNLGYTALELVFFPTNPQTIHSDAPFEEAKFDKWNVHLVSYLLQKGAKIENPVLKKESIFHCFLREEAPGDLSEILPYLNLNARDAKGNTLLHTVFKDGIRKKLSKQAIKRAKELLACEGLPINAKNKLGYLPLHYLCMHPYSEELVETMCEQGADPNRQTKLGSTPMHYLGALQYGKSRSWKILKKHGADTSIKNRKKEAPLYYHSTCGLLNWIGIGQVPAIPSAVYSAALDSCLGSPPSKR